MAPSSRSAQMRRRSSPQSRTIAYEVLEPRKLLAGFIAQVGDGGGDLVINEIMYHPSSDNALEEYVELHNTTGVALDLQQWQLTDAVQFTFPAVTIAPGGFLVVASDLASFQTKYPTVTNVVGGWEGQLSNRSEKITLEDDTGFDVSALTYADEGAWAERVRGPLLLNHEGWQWDPSHDGDGSSLELRQAVLSIEIGQNWGASETLQGTPGVANSIATTNAAPLISDASHFPAIPSSSDAVTVSATIVNEETSGVTVDAFYRVDGTATFNSVTLFDNGNHNDGAAGDGVFAAQLPAQADGAIIEFYIQASDADSNVRTFPSPSLPSGQQLTNLLYQVDDSFDANDPNAGSAFASYRLIMTEAERAELEQIGDVSAEDESNAQMNGTFIAIDGSTIDVRYNVGIRNRGAGSRNATPNNYRVNLPSDQPWRDFDALNINAQFPYLQKLGLQLFQEAGSPSETGQIISLRVNGADLSLPGDPSFGHYIHVTPGNSDLVKQQFPADSNGNLYQARRDGTSTPADLRVLDTLEDYQEHYQKNTNSSENDYSDLIDLILKLNETPDATYLQTIEQVVDVDNWLAYFAINAILATDETALATGDGDDYLLYSGNNDARFKLLPHDFDSILGQGDSIGSATSGIYVAAENPTIERFLLHDEILPQYHAKLNQLLTTTFAKVAFDPLVEGALSDFLPPSEINELVEFMDERRSYISSLIDGELTISSPLPEFNGYPRSTTGFAAVSGSASLSQTQSVLVNGQLATLDQASGVWELGDVGNATVATLVSPGSNWQYLDAGNVPSTSAGSDWRIDDPGWTDSGDAELGYGDGDSSTTIVDFVDTDPDASGTQKNITTYFRKTFDVADVGEITGLTLNLLRDDGAIVFLNGEELLRDNLPSGPITSTTTAEDVVGGGDEDAFFAFTVDHTKLVSGQNVIAVEIHQISDSSSDISFDLELLANVAGTPSSGGVALVPGINRLVAESYSGTAGTGELLDSAFVDLWYDSGTTQSIGGPIETDTTLIVAGSPYVVTSDLIVRAGATLTIEPGVSIMFDNDVGLEVTDTGRIVAEGTESQRILFTNNPATSNGWDGVRIVDTQSDNRFSYADFVNGAGQGEALVVDHGRAVFDNVSWSGFQQQVMNLDHPTLVVSNSSIPGINAGETVALSGLDQGEQLEFIGNVFGKNTSGGDVIDVGHNTLTPQQVIIRGNVFQGGDDDGIDTDGFPVLIENNIFYGFHYNTSRTTTSNAVSTGRSDVDGQIVSSDLTLIGNIFYDNDHHLLLKDFSSAVLMNNTFYDATIAAISLNEPNGSNVAGPGASLISDGNIFSGFPLLFEAREASTYVEINRSIVPAEFHSEGVGNIDADPSFNDPFNQDFTLRPDSPAFGTGPNGTNIGAFQGSPFAAQTGLRISEIHFNPAAPTAAETSAGFIDNDDFEFLELFNSSTTGVINLDGVQLSDGVTFDFGNIELQPGERAVVVEDIDAFMTRYGNSARVIGQWSGALSNGGEEVTLIDGDMNEIVSVNYGDNDPWYNRADGDGYSLVLDDAVNTPVEELGKYYSWRASAELGGTPGATSTDPVGVVINEILAHTDAPQSDSIELYNPTGQAIDIGGWFLSDSVSSPFKFAIPDGTTISAGGYLVFDESDFNPSPATPSVNHFALSSNGDDVLLSRPIFTAGVVAALIEDSVSFGATFNGQSLGRLPNGTGRLARLASTSLGAANGVAEVGPLVISEISYHPNDPSAEALAIDSLLTDNDLEYIEIANPTSAAIDLTNWRLRGEADFDFAAGTALAAGEATIVVSFDPSIATNAGRLAAFRTHYGIGSEVMIVGGLSASLSNNSGRISLQQPDAADLLGEIPHVVVDEVVYDDRAPWADADGSGQVLERDDLSANGNLATSWIAASPTPGILESQFLLGDANQDGIVNFLDISPFISILSNREYLLEADINQDGVVDFFDIAPFIDELTR